MGLIYSKHGVKVIEWYNDGTFKSRPKGTPYYTVVNAETNKHRHYDIKSTALAVARKTANVEIPKFYGLKIKKDILFLLTGNEDIY